MDYQKRGEEFLKGTGTKMTVKFAGNDMYFDDDTEPRDIYRVTLERNGKKYSFRFGQSINRSSTGVNKKLAELDRIGESPWSVKTRAVKKGQAAPTAYDVLACLTKSDPGTLDDFVSEYGYQDAKVSRIIKTYNAVVEEWQGVSRLFSDVMEKLQEIQ